MNRPRHSLLPPTLLLLLLSGPALAIEVVAVEPARESLTAATDSEIRVTFDTPVDAATLSATTFRAYARWSGPVTGTREISADGRTIILRPTRRFSAGETVDVNLSHDLRGTDTSSLRPAGYAYRFVTRAAPAGRVYVETHRTSVRSDPDDRVAIYGGLACDLDLDGFLDLSIVSEASADMRVFENADDGSATFEPFRVPPTPVGLGASPSEADDFDLDGAIDVCVANTHGDSVTVVMGDGNGGFAPPVNIGAVAEPRGMVLLDVDGDGDRDIVTTNYSTDAMTLLRSNGDGTFGAAETFDGGGSGEWGLSTADMNGDGIYDLVVGLRDEQRVNVMLGNGDGTFTGGAPVRADAFVWMIGTGDVNGDGHVDVAASSNSPGGGTLLIGDGTGSLGVAAQYSLGGHTPATDFGDLDGDGDLDWVLSGYSGQVWRVLTNDGTGTFTPTLDVPARSNPGCAVVFDADSDGDLDLALLDEVADEVVIVRNGPRDDDAHDPSAAVLSPKKVRLRLPAAKRRGAPRLDASGTLHLGPDVDDLTLPVTVVVGDLEVTAPLDRVAGNGRRTDFAGGGAQLRLRSAGSGSSRAKFSLRVDADLADQAPGGLLAFGLRTAQIDSSARVQLRNGKFAIKAPAGLREPSLAVTSLRAKLRGGSADVVTLKLQLPPAEEPLTGTLPVTVAVGRAMVLFPADSFGVSGGVLRLAAPRGGVRKLTIDPATGRVTCVADGLPLGDFDEAPLQPLTVSIGIGDEAYSVTVVTAQKRGKLRY